MQTGDGPVGSTATPLLRLEHVSKTYRSSSGPVSALREIDLNVDVGECVALIGPSGSGKSTLLLIAAGLLAPDDGGVASVGGRSWAEFGAGEREAFRRQRIGFVFQELNLVSFLTVGENVMLPLMLDGTPRRAARQRADDALAALGLATHGNRMPNELSGGQQQRVAIARATVGGQQIIFADEPTGSLDTATSEGVFAALMAHADQGGAVVIVSHDPLVAKFASRTIVLRDGHLDAV
jgi:putative ABC transport system ATP-binding protein